MVIDVQKFIERWQAGHWAFGHLPLCYFCEMTHFDVLLLLLCIQKKSRSRRKLKLLHRYLVPCRFAAIFYLAQRAMKGLDITTDNSVFERIFCLDLHTYYLLEGQFSLLYDRSRIQSHVHFQMNLVEPHLSRGWPKMRVLNA